MRFLYIFVFLLGGVSSSPIFRADAPTCEPVCHPISKDKINVHLIPHSHDDVGWKKTVDQYFYGSQNNIHRGGVQYIISSVVAALKEDPNRRFVQVEMAFFWKWWQQQSDNVRQDFIDLVNNGQIEILNAAWSMNDEASVHYQSTIDQFTWGLHVINETVGPCGSPRIGWQIDPFGHTREQTSIFSQLGYDATFFARIDQTDKDNRKNNKNLELIWQGSANLDNSNVFATIFYDHYHAPGGFCFDMQCGDIIYPDPNSPDYNLPERVDAFSQEMDKVSAYYKTNNLMITMGADFHYESAHKNFLNMDHLLKGFENHEKYNVIYSTPSCYVKAVNEAASENNIEFALKTDDFLPYASDTHSYWTGFYTSRPNAKRFERLANNYLQAAKQLTSYSKINGADHQEDLRPLKEALGIIQHHDAITGTEKQAVNNDYIRMLSRGIKKAETSLGTTITDLLKKDASSDIKLSLESCLMSNMSICEPAKKDRFVVTVYNPLERPVTHYIRVPVPDGTYKVTGPDGEEITDLLDSISDFGYVKDIPESPSPKELVFAAKDIPALGVKLYYVEKSSSESMQRKPTLTPRFGTDTTGFEIDDDSGRLKTITVNGKKLEVTQDFLYYTGANGDNSNGDKRASGAYIFRPNEQDAIQVTSDGVSVVSSTTGNLVDEVKQQFSDWITQIIRVYKSEGENHIEFDWLIGPIPVDDDNKIGREVITRFTVDNFNNGDIFYTDSNGREMIKRQLNKRSDYEYDATLEPVSSNYYPVTSKIVVRDEDQNLEVAVLNDRAQGGASLKSGQVEIMVHRRLLKDDGKGVDEALNEQEFGQGVVARGQHYLTFGDVSNVVAQERELALKKLLTPIVFVGDATSEDLTLDKVQEELNFKFDGLQASLPDNVHILTLESVGEDSFILRLEHILEKGEDDALSQTATVNLEGLFTLFDISDIQETTLGANQLLEKFQAKQKYVWNINGGKKVSNNKIGKSPRDGSLEITLDPMQIRTFIIQVNKKQ